MNLTSPFSISLVAITALAFLGLPIGHSMIAGSILYLLLAGLDMGTAAEQLLNGMYSNYVILVGAAVHPGRRVHEHRQHDRPPHGVLQRPGRPLPRRPRPGQHPAEHHLRRHVRLGHRRCRRHGPHDAGHDDPRRPVYGELCGGADGGLLGDRTDHPALDPDGALRARLRRLDRLSLPGRRRSGPADGARAR